MEQNPAFTKPFRNEGDALAIDNEISNLKRAFLKNYDSAFIELLNAMIRNANHKEFYKLKEFFLTHCENLQELPKMNDEGIDKFIEAILLVCQKWPTPLTSKGFRVFHKFLVNKQGYKNNEPVKKRFKFTKPNLSRLGLEHYLEDKENLSFAMECCLSYLLENEHAYSRQLFETEKNCDFALWWDRRNQYKITAELFKQIDDVKIDLQSIELVKTQLKSENSKIASELKKEMDFTNGDVNDLKAAFQEMKEQIRVLKSEYAKYSDLTEWKRDLEKTIDRRIHDVTEMMNTEYGSKNFIKNLEFLVKKHKEDHDAEIAVIRQDTQGKFKAFQDDLTSRLEAKEERVYKLETELRNMFKESDEKFLQLQTYTKNYVEKILENNNAISQSITKLSSDTQVHFNHLESGNVKFEKNISDIQEKLNHVASKVEMDKFIRKTEEIINKYKQDITTFGETQDNHAKSLETIFKVMSDNKKFLEMKFLLVDEVANKMVTHNFEIENAWTEIKWLKEKADFLGNSLNDTNNTLFKMTDKVEQVQNELNQDVKILNEKCDETRNKIMIEIANSLSKLKDETKDAINKTYKEINSLQENLNVNKIELKDILGTITSLQTEFTFYNQSLSNAQINIGNLNTKIETIHKTLEKQFSIEQESLASKILDFSGQINNLKEKVKDSENVLNPFPRKIFSIEVKIEELTRYFGLQFNRADELEAVIQEPLSNIKVISEENKKLLTPFISSLLADFKNISNKIPFYQKRIGQLQKLIMNTDNDKGKKTPSNANSGKLDIQSNNQEPVLKSLSKLAQPFDEVGEEGILTADDVNTNLYSLRTELMAEIAKMFGSLIQGHKEIEGAQKDLLEKVVEFEQKLNSGTMSSEINQIKSSVQAWQDNLDKLKQIMRNDILETNKYFNKNQNVYNEKLQIIENELRTVKKQLLNATLTAGKSPTNSEIKFSEAEAPMRTILKRMDLVELIADDYLELHVEREVIKCQQKLSNITYNLEDKIAAYSYILQHYRLINNNLMTNSFRKFHEILTSNRNATQLKSLKLEYFPHLYPLIKNSYDCFFPNFVVLIESLMLFMTEDENFVKILERNSLVLLVEHVENSPNMEAQISATKLLGTLSQNNSIIGFFYTKGLMSRLWKFIVQIFERYPLIQNNIGGDNTEPKEENLFKKNMGSGLEESKENKSSGRRCTEEISTIVDFLVTKDPQKLTNGFSQTKENAFKIFQYEELVYNSMFIIYNAMLKHDFSQQCDYLAMFNALVNIGSDDKTPHQIAEISLLCIYLITERKKIKYEEIENIPNLKILGHIIQNPKNQQELQDLVFQIFTNLCKDEKTYNSLNEKIDLGKLGIKGYGQSSPSGKKNASSNILNFFHPPPYYEGAVNSLLNAATDSNYEQQSFKKPPRIMTMNGTTTDLKGGLKDNQSRESRGNRTPDVRTTNQDVAGRRYTSKDRGGLPSNHNVNKTVDSATTLQPNNNNQRNSNKRIPTREGSIDSLQDKGDKNTSKKPQGANFQLPTLNTNGRPLFKNQ